MKYPVFIILLLLICVAVYFYSHITITQKASTQTQASVTIQPSKVSLTSHMTITSPAFADHTTIPMKYTCDGESINPPLSFSNIPQNAKSLVLLVDDPDVPKTIKSDGIFDHWVIYNIDPSIKEIGENSVPSGTQGLNSSGQRHYTGPCPPDREHRYFFKLYALDTTFDFPDSSTITKQTIITKMQNHIIEQAELVGVYNRQRNK